MIVMLLFACLQLFSLQGAIVDVFKSRSLGLRQLFSDLNDRFAMMDELSAMHAVAWCMRHKNEKIMRKVTHWHWRPSEFTDDLFLDAVLRFFSPNVALALKPLIRSRAEEGGNIRTNFIQLLNGSLDLIEAPESFMGYFEQTPDNALAIIGNNVGAEDLMNMACTCWGLRDVFIDGLRRQFYRFERKRWQWVLSSAQIYQKWVTETEPYKRAEMEAILARNYIVSLVWNYLIAGQPFNANKFRTAQESALVKEDPYEDSFEGWLVKYAKILKPDFLQTLFNGPLGSQVTWYTFSIAVNAGMDPKSLAVIISNISPEWVPTSEHLELARKHLDSKVISAMVSSRIEVNSLLEDSDSVQLLVEMSLSSEDLLNHLTRLKCCREVAPLRNTVDLLLSGRFSQECFSMFLKKFPQTSLSMSQWMTAQSLGLGGALLAQLLLNVKSTISIHIFESLPDGLSEDDFLIFVSKCDFGFYQRHLLKAMEQNYSELTIRMMIRRSSVTLGEKDLNLIAQAALRVGYSEELIWFIKSSM